MVDAKVILVKNPLETQFYQKRDPIDKQFASIP